METTTTAVTRPARTGRPTAANRFGYVVAIGCNVAGLYMRTTCSTGDGPGS